MKCLKLGYVYHDASVFFQCDNITVVSNEYHLVTTIQ